MIASLRGTLIDRTGGACVVDVAGVGYLVQVSAHTLAALPEVGQELFVRTRQVVREDSVALYGFLDAGEMKLFDLLITVSGVGPRLAMAVLSGLRADALAKAIRSENVGALVAIPGVGRKTAERLVVELRDKLELSTAAGSSTAPKGTGVLPQSARFDDAIAALSRLGYTAGEARDAVQRVADEKQELSLEAIVRMALSELGKPTTSKR